MSAIIASTAATMSMSLLPIFFMLIYFACIIAVIVFMIILFVRLVKAVEKIANSIENYTQPNPTQQDQTQNYQ